jgi:hypothetical protein
MFSTTQMVLMQIFRIRSAYIFAGITCFMLTGVVGRGVWRYVMPLGLLAAGTVEAVTSVRHLSSLAFSKAKIFVLWLTGRPWTFSLPSLDEWAKTHHRNSSSPPYPSLLGSSWHPPSYPCSTAYLVVPKQKSWSPSRHSRASLS